MEAYFLCMKCTYEDNLNNSEFYPVEIDDAFFEGKEVCCQNGHTFFLANKSLKSSFLFEQGLYSYNKGFYAEAFNAIYTGFEYYKQEVVSLYLFNLSKRIDKMESITKPFFNLSERIEGAYRVAFYSMFKKEPCFIDQKNVSVRNSIIHKGHIASKQDCTILGNDVFYKVSKMNNMFTDNMFRYAAANESEKENIPFLLSYPFDKARYAIDQRFDWVKDYNEKFQVVDLSSSLKISPSSPYKGELLHNQLFEEIAEKTKNRTTIFEKII